MSRDNRRYCSHIVRVSRLVCHEDESLSLLPGGIGGFMKKMMMIILCVMFLVIELPAYGLAVDTVYGKTTVSANKKHTSKKQASKKKKSSGKYNPKRVAALAVKMCEKKGMITTEKNLKNLLDTGKITKEEYDEYYPLDGMENSYYSVFINVNLKKATTISGERLKSEKAIADYIAGMMLLEENPLFNIKYVGVYKTSKEKFYEFRCYR